ncbi:MAG: hypothetical protein NT030_07345 [Candidatus Saganbacteria bacterium]|nr:hypothetical protein [Candidatus Saganbacteria bacterium]
MAENNKTDKLLLISQAESTDRIITSILQYFVSINLASYAGLAWLYNLGEGVALFSNKGILITLFSAIIILADMIIYHIYLRTNCLAVKCSDDMKEQKLYYEDIKDKYLRLTHKTISFALSFFFTIILFIFIVSLGDPMNIFNIGKLNIYCLILPILIGVGLYINAMQKEPFLFGMNDC